jgi:hypothetical protein
MNTSEGLSWLDTRFGTLSTFIEGQLRQKSEGVLYLAIRELCPDHAEDICREFRIERLGQTQDDLDRVGRATGGDPWPIRESLLCEIRKVLTGRQTELAQRVARTALTVIVGWYLKQQTTAYRTVPSRGHAAYKHAGTPTGWQPLPENALAPLQGPASLCLVVPSAVATDLVAGHAVEPAHLLELVGNATYFGAALTGVAQHEEEQFGLTAMTEGQEQDIYLRVDLKNGADLQGAATRYSLKKSLGIHPRGGTLGRIAALVSHNRSGFLRRT